MLAAWHDVDDDDDDEMQATSAGVWTRFDDFIHHILMCLVYP